MGTLFIQFSFSFSMTAVFTIVTNVSKRSLICCGLSSVFGWIICWICARTGGSAAFGLLLNSLGAAFINDFFSEHLRMPITIFNVPGMVPSVPGGLAYQTVRNLVTKSYQEAAHYAVQVAMIVGATALGPILSRVFNRSIHRFKEKRDAIILRREKRLLK